MRGFIRYASFGLILMLFPPGIKRSGRDVIGRKYHIRIEEESHLVINGSTNINTFSCGYNGSFLDDTLTVNAISSGDNLRLNNAMLKLRTVKFSCNNRLMNPDFQHLLQADKYPYIIIHVLEIRRLSAGSFVQSISKNYPGNNNILLSVEITLAGRKNTYQLPVSIRNIRHHKFYQGYLDLDIRDFGLTPPIKMLGLVKVSEMVRINFIVQLSMV